MLAVGCGTLHAGAAKSQTVDLAAAVSHTQDQTARIATTISTQTQGMTVSFTESGLFDFARSRGTITMQSPIGLTEVFLPPTTYIKFPAASDADAGGGGLPKGKTWVALPDGATDDSAAAGSILGPLDGGGDPAGLLASLTAASSSVTRLGPTVIRGVPVTGFALKIDPAKAGAKIPGADRAAVEAFLKSFDAGAIPVDVWVDGENRVRREKLSLAMPGGSGAPAGTSLTVTTDFYDFGVPVRVSAPPASQVDTEKSLFAAGPSGSESGSGSGSSGPSGAGSPPPPPASGTLTPDQATSAEQAVTAFWAALGRNNTTAVAATVLPAQRSCVQSSLGSGGPTISVSALHITSAQPSGDSSATVRFTVKAQASLGGQDIPVLPQGPGSGQWLATTEVAGHWYVNLEDSTALAFGGGCD
jgi:hypothetical protein